MLGSEEEVVSLLTAQLMACRNMIHVPNMNLPQVRSSALVEIWERVCTLTHQMHKLWMQNNFHKVTLPM